MLHSDHFKALEGEWLIWENPDGKGIIVEFGSLIRLDMRTPRWLFERIGKGKIEKLVRGIRDGAEKRKP